MRRYTLDANSRTAKVTLESDHMTDDDLNGECIMECRRMLAQELGIHTAFFDDSVRNAIILVNVLARGFKALDSLGGTVTQEVIDAREALTFIKPEHPSNNSEATSGQDQ